MANRPDKDIRRLFTEIGWVMDNASLVALVWKADDEIGVSTRFQNISDVHEKIGQLLMQVANAN